LALACGGSAPPVASEANVPLDLRPYADLYEHESEEAADQLFWRECSNWDKDYPVDKSNGIDRCEAYTLASAYFVDELKLTSGGPGSPVDRGNTWLVPVRVGYAGEPALPLRIDKTDGVVIPVASSKTQQSAASNGT